MGCPGCTNVTKCLYIAIILSILAFSISGCAWTQGFLGGVADPAGSASLVAGEAVGAVVGNVAEEIVPILPSPWRELLLAVLGLIAGFFGKVAADKKKEEGSA